ncbi:response regulator [Streptomyces sp. NPDC002458]|uniref:Response regulator transcription factor n=1 Tax=Streptomyces sp. NBC_00148 TaxID=2903626 RepID=A0AAU1LYS5_9ACTN
MSARVVVADDQSVVREGIVMLLGLLPGIEVVGAAKDGDEAVALVAEMSPDVVLMDLRMPRCDGVEATRRIRREHPGTQVVVLTTFADDDSLFTALQAGARGYLTKDARGEEIAQAIEAVLSGEAEVLVLIADGLSNVEIARTLHISRATVKTHINNLFSKTGARDRTGAVRYAYGRGLAHPPGTSVT